MRDVTLEEIKEYAAEDADVTFQLKELFAVELEKTQTTNYSKILKFRLYPFLLQWKQKESTLVCSKACRTKCRKEIDTFEQKNI
jgi:DNA polymerase-1